MKSNIEQRRIVAYLDSFSLMRDLWQARLASHKGMILQVRSGEEPTEMSAGMLLVQAGNSGLIRKRWCSFGC